MSSVTRTARRLGRRIILPVRLEGGALRATMHVRDLSIVRYFGEGQLNFGRFLSERCSTPI